MRMMRTTPECSLGGGANGRRKRCMRPTCGSTPLSSAYPRDAASAASGGCSGPRAPGRAGTGWAVAAPAARAGACPAPRAHQPPSTGTLGGGAAPPRPIPPAPTPRRRLAQRRGAPRRAVPLLAAPRCAAPLSPVASPPPRRCRCAAAAAPLPRLCCRSPGPPRRAAPRCPSLPRAAPHCRSYIIHAFRP